MIPTLRPWMFQGTSLHFLEKKDQVTIMAMSFKPAASAPKSPPLAPAPKRSIFSGCQAAESNRTERLGQRPGTYWVRVELLKVRDPNHERKVFVCGDYQVAKVIEGVEGVSFKEGDRAGSVSDIASQFFNQDMTDFIWAAFNDQWKEAGLNRKGEIAGEDFEKALEVAFGPEQPLTNTVIEVQVRSRNGMPKTGKNAGKMMVYEVVDWREVVPAEVLASELSDDAKRQFPAGFFN